MSNDFAKFIDPTPVFSDAGIVRKPSSREEVLRDAMRLTTVDRDKTYGNPTRNMQAFADFIRVYEKHRADFPTAHDAAIIMALAKIARIAVGKTLHRDNYTDATAYLAMAYEATQSDLSA